MAKRKGGEPPEQRQNVQLIPFAGQIKFGAFHNRCGAGARIWNSKKPTPVLVVFVNVGICSLDVAVNGAQALLIPSRARRPDVVVHPGATTIDVDCVLNVQGGDCDYFFFIITF